MAAFPKHLGQREKRGVRTTRWYCCALPIDHWHGSWILEVLDSFPASVDGFVVLDWSAWAYPHRESYAKHFSAQGWWCQACVKPISHLPVLHMLCPVDPKCCQGSWAKDLNLLIIQDSSASYSVSQWREIAPQGKCKPRPAKDILGTEEEPVKWAFPILECSLYNRHFAEYFSCGV